MINVSHSNSLPQDTQSSFIQVNHTKLFCQTMGKGPPLIILHGGPGLSQDYLLPQMSRLAAHHFLVFYDQRGSGRSDDEKNLTRINLNTFVEDLEEVRQKFNLKRVSILGHSWGAFLAMKYAISHPKVVDKLILVSSMPASNKDFALSIEECNRRLQPFMKEVEQIVNSKEFLEQDPGTLADHLRMIFRSYCFNPQDADKLNLSTSYQAHINYLKVAEIFEKTLFANPFDLYDNLKKLSCKTLFIHGNEDPFSLAFAKKAHITIKNSQFEIIKDCGHFPYIEKPQEFFKLLNKFLVADKE